jgi:hypothetical protein
VFRRFNVPYWVSADGSGRAGPVPAGLVNDIPSSPGPDSDSFVAVCIQPETAGDIFLLSISGKFQAKPLLVTTGTTEVRNCRRTDAGSVSIWVDGWRIGPFHPRHNPNPSP